MRNLSGKVAPICVHSKTFYRPNLTETTKFPEQLFPHFINPAENHKPICRERGWRRRLPGNSQMRSTVAAQSGKIPKMTWRQTWQSGKMGKVAKVAKW
jgi:hypothetical protein